MRNLVRLLLNLRRVDTLRLLRTIAGTAANGFPGPSTARAWAASDGIQGWVNLPGVVAQCTGRLSLLLSPTKALEMLAGDIIS